MRFSQTFIPTLREDPAEAEVISHKLMVRAGLIRKAAAGYYSWLPLGWRVLRKVENIVREEMDRAGSLELLMPIVQPKEIWEATGRWGAYGNEMMRLCDRHDREFCLGPTHEEMITSIAKELRSYKDLPKCLYQIQAKFRDEIRPRFGVMRSREFVMKDAYSFHASEESLSETYDRMSEVYVRIVERCGLTYRSVKAAGGLIGGAASEEFMVLADAGEDVVIYCPKCNYAANLETATSKWHSATEDEPIQARRVEETPGKRSVDEVAEFMGVAPERLIKTLILRVGEDTVAALVLGHKELNPAKLATVLGVGEARLFTEEDFAARPDLVSGFVGPVGLENVKIVADHSIKGMRNFVAGANQLDHHFRNINVDEDFAVDVWADLVVAQVGESCAQCGDGRLETIRGIEVGHIFKLGTKYSELLGAEYIDEGGQARPFIMGCYGIGVSRIVAAAIEQKNDEAGIVWPPEIAPYDAHLITLGKDETVSIKAEALYVRLSEELDVLYDDRPVSAGIKFSDADLIGIPFQVIMGKRFLETEKVEVKNRATGAKVELSVEELPGWLKQAGDGRG